MVTFSYTHQYLANIKKIFSIFSSGYAVVEFVDNNEVEIIPTSWLVKDRKKCVWPNQWKPTRISNAVRQKHPPDYTFTTFKIKVLYETGMNTKLSCDGARGDLLTKILFIKVRYY